MRWDVAKSDVQAGSAKLRLKAEQEQLEQLIANTRNRALAEMARIKLRVVRFVSRNTREENGAPVSLPRDGRVESITLPASVSYVSSAHLLDLNRQQPMLDQIHQSVPRQVVDTATETASAASGIFYASSVSPMPRTAWRRERALRAGGLIVFLLGITFVLGVLSRQPIDRSSLAAGGLMIAFPATVMVIAWLRRVTRNDGVVIAWDGVRVGRTRHLWHEVGAVTLTVHDGYCECEIELRGGEKIETTLSCFSPDLDTWLERLRLFLANPEVERQPM